jgi:hypothetical protein
MLLRGRRGLLRERLEVRRVLLKALLDAGITENVTELGGWLLDVLRRSPR